MKKTQQQFKSFLYSKVFIISTFLLLILFTVAVFYQLQSEQHRSNRLFLEKTIDVYAVEFKSKISSYQAELENIARFYHSSNYLDYDKFVSFVKPVFEKESGIQALKWIPKVSLDKLALHQKNSRLYNKDYNIWQANSLGTREPVTARGFYYPVMYVWPKIGNEATLGFDLGSNKQRLQALMFSQESAQATASAKIQRLQDEQAVTENAAFLIIHPYYKKQDSQNVKPRPTTVEYRENLVGFILGVFNVAKMFESVIKNLPAKGFDIEVYDRSDQNAAQLLHTHLSRLRTNSGDSLSLRNNSAVVREFKFANRSWSFHYYPTKYYHENNRQFNAVTLLIIASVMVFLVLFYLLILRQHMIKVSNAIEYDHQDLVKSELQHRTVIETIADALIVIDEFGEIEALNIAAMTMFNYQQDELVGLNINVLITDLRAPQDDKIVDCCRELLIKCKAGQQFMIELNMKSMTVNGNLKFTVMIHDITKRKNFEKQLIAAKKHAEAGVKSKNEFLATMSHEIRTPMNGVLGMVQILRATKLSIDQLDYLEIIQNSGTALLEVINDILDFSKIEAGQLKLDPIVFNLEKLILDVIQLLDTKAQQKNIRLIFNYCDHCADIVLGDPGRIRQVLINLIGNSIKFTDKGHIYISVFLIRKKQQQCTFHVSIQDTGVGISKDYLENLFDSFTQAHSSTTRKYGGSGLGLAICKQLVTLMAGVIGVDSKLKQGSTFWFEIPLLDSSTDAKLDAPKLDNNSVLLIEHYPQSCSQLEIQLSNIGVAVECVDCYSDAISILSAEQHLKTRYDTIIFDSIIEQQSSVDLVKKFRCNQDFNQLAIIVLSSQPKIGDAKLFHSAGATAYLTKPLLTSVFYQCLTKVFSLESYFNQELITRHSINVNSDAKNLIELKFDGHVLIAEDNLVNQKVIEAMLRNLGISCEIAENGEQAISSWTEKEFDLIFMDCQMPIMDGFLATAAIRHIEKQQQLTAIPIVALTANVLQADRQQCFDVGMNDFLAKPIVVGILQDILQKWLVVNNGSLLKVSTATELDEDHQSDAFTEFTLLQNDNQSCLDLNKITQLRELMGAAFSTLISSYVAGSEEKIEEIKAALESLDSQKIYELAHNLKGTSGNIGAEQMLLFASQIELQSKQKQLDNIGAIVDDLLNAFTKTKLELSQLVDLQEK